MARIGHFYFGDGTRLTTEEESHRRKHKTMAANILPRAFGKLISMAEDMADGGHTHEVAIGVKQNTEAVIRAALAAATAAESGFGAAQVAKKNANAALKIADNNARVFIGNARKRLSKFFGEAFSTEWAAAGWPNNSTGTPETRDERFALMNSLKLYFTANPAKESADMEVTAAIAATIHTALSDARASFAQKTTEVGDAKVARDNAVENLRSRMRGLITELETLLADDDPRWHAFGLSRPADEETPEAPSFTTAIASTPGTGLIDWDDALRADHYRVWILIVGVDEDFHAVETVNDSDATLTGLPTGATVKVRVTSVNAAGESQPGPVAEFVVA